MIVLHSNLNNYVKPVAQPTQGPTRAWTRATAKLEYAELILESQTDLPVAHDQYNSMITKQ